ncbi:MAG: hypothetical protein KBG02_16820 [Haliscomenobacter sp.]|nr:hypothetical protein [Haliscomenobacter sp.]
MSFWDLFKKGASGPGFLISDLVWVTEEAKQTGFVNLIRQHPQALVLVWFDRTEETFQALLLREQLPEVAIQRARMTSSEEVEGKTVIFLEHYPLLSREVTLTRGWKPAQALFLTALDEPLFSRFGGDRLVNLVQQLGLEETENLEHPMITKSIARAQRKLDEKLKGGDILAESQEEWFQKLEQRHGG